MRMRKLGVLAAGLTAAATMLLGAGAASAATTSVAVPDSTNCAPPIGSHRVCLDIVTSSTNHLFVQSVTVRNIGEPTGYGWIENMGNHVKHRSPTRLQAGQSWTYAVNRAVANNDKWCGWIGSNPNEMACGTVRS